jgi:hypothetical protein
MITEIARMADLSISQTSGWSKIQCAFSTLARHKWQAECLELREWAIDDGK